ncbi:hypothetical protein Q8A73_007603 [Channa argus]|nr:hypothetical protein Q8A73_007603 [Channa argus]
MYVHIGSVFCDTCALSAISPLDCIGFPLKCPPWGVKHTQTSVKLSGDLRVLLCEKICILPSMCGVTGENHTMELNFTFTKECCNTWYPLLDGSFFLQEVLKRLEIPRYKVMCRSLHGVMADQALDKGTKGTKGLKGL